MAIRFNTEKYNQIKAEYLKFIEEGSANALMMREFNAYQMYLDVDEDVKSARARQLIATSKRQSLENESKRDTKQSFDELYANIDKIKQEIRKLRYVTSEQKSEIEQLHHDIIFYPDLSSKQKLQINRNMLSLQKIVNDTETYVRCKHITDLIDNLKTFTMEDGFVEERKSIRTKIKKDKRILEGDIKHLLHMLNQTAPYVPKAEHPKAHVDTKQQPVIEFPRKIEELVVPWSQIVFHDNVIRITDANGKFLLAPRENCRRSYNQIKEYIAEKLPLIVVIKNQDGKWALKEPVVFKNALKILRKRESEELIQEEKYKRALRSFASMEEYLQYRQNQEHVLARLKEKKQEFLNYLIKCQIEDYKLVPAIEVVAHESSENAYEEDVFIFTIPYKSYRTGTDCVNIVYENINESRASIVCTVEKKNYSQALQSLFNFMNDENQKNKRSRLHQTLRLSNTVRRLHVVNHTDMHSWAMSIQY